MFTITTEIRKEIDDLRNSVNGDVAAVAMIDKLSNTLHWLYVSGSRSERYRRISFKIGHGIAGIAMRLARNVSVNPLVTGGVRLRQECSLMLAEQLHSALAIPLTGFDDLPMGVLLIGNRDARIFLPAEITLAEQIALQLSGLCFIEPIQGR